MGYRLNDVIKSCASYDDFPPKEILVTGSSVTNVVILKQDGNYVMLDLWMIADLFDLLKSKGIVE